MLSKKQLKDVCLLGALNANSHKQCRYLCQDDLDSSKYLCVKLNATQKKDIDSEIDLFLEECKKTGADPLKANVPMGNNCVGYPILKNIQQGYDVKN